MSDLTRATLLILAALTVAACGPIDRSPTPAVAARAMTGPAPAVFFATGTSISDDPMLAAREATAQVVSAFARAHAALKAVVFLERVKGVSTADGERIGQAVRAVAKVPTYGTGATGPYGLAWINAADRESSFLVLGIGGSDVQVNGFVKGGKPSFIYKPGGGTRDAKKDATLALWRIRGRDLAEMVPADDRNGVALLLGTMHNWAHVELAHGFDEAMPRGLTPIGGCGQWEDYVFADGQPVTDEYNFGKPTPCGQLAIIIRGPIRLAAAGKACANTRDAEVVRRDTAEVVQALNSQLRGAAPAAILGFGCVTRLREARLPAQHERHAIADAFGSHVPLFGCYAGGEIGLMNDGVMDAGGDRLVLVAVVPDMPNTGRPADPD